MNAPWQDSCAGCQQEIPPRGNKARRIPWRKGKYGIVCDGCAEAIDAQGTLTGEDGRPVGSRPKKERLAA